MADSDDSSRLRQECELYRGLLELADSADPAQLVRDALALVVKVIDARHGYLEVHGDIGAGEVRWSTAHEYGPQEIDAVRHAVSTGIVAEALASGETIVTASAELDDRFEARDSVRSGHIGAVLCIPIGRTSPVGVLYLHSVPGRAFSLDDRRCAETFARHLAPQVDRLLQGLRDPAADPTTPFRERLRIDGIVGRSAVMADVFRQVAAVAALDVSVLLTGDSGSGKSQIARAIHDNSPRAAHPFVEVNCAALPEHLLESELFGAEPGAHSTATRRMPGRVSAAESGTLFLDEVAELSPLAQAKVLQLLQTREFYPLGRNRPLRADVRIIAATNTDLAAAVAARRFREDLYYRLHVVPLRMPSLAERREDIPLLAEAFAIAMCRRHQLPRLRLSPAALHAVVTAPWPGNVRQLEHAIESAVILAAGDRVDEIGLAHLFPESLDRKAAHPEAIESFQAATRRFQATLLRAALERNDWNVSTTARELDLTRSHVYNLVNAFQLGRPREPR